MGCAITIPTGLKGDKGDSGTNGTNGNTLLNGVVDPTTEGVDGDFYINTATNTIFGPKASGVWPSGISLVGPAGADSAEEAFVAATLTTGIQETIDVTNRNLSITTVGVDAILTGILNPTDGKQVTVFNNDAGDIVVKHDDGSVGVANRIYTPDQGDYVIEPFSVVIFKHNNIQNRWIVSSLPIAQPYWTSVSPIITVDTGTLSSYDVLSFYKKDTLSKTITLNVDVKSITVGSGSPTMFKIPMPESKLPVSTSSIIFNTKAVLTQGGTNHACYVMTSNSLGEIRVLKDDGTAYAGAGWSGGFQITYNYTD